MVTEAHVPGYIQQTIDKIKAVDVEKMRVLMGNGNRRVRFTLADAPGASKKPATASVPISWIVGVRDRYDASGRTQEAAFEGFVSDWISGWV